MKSSFITRLIIEMEIKKVGLIRAYFLYSFYNVENDEKIHLKNGEMLKVKRGFYTMKNMEFLQEKINMTLSLANQLSILRPFRPYMNKILGINNENYIDTLLSKKIYSFKINKLSTTDNIFKGKPCDVLYTRCLNKDISFGDTIYFEPKNIQYKKLVNGIMDRLKILLIDRDGNGISSNFRISIVLHLV